MADICKCADWFLVAVAAAEALEHNATVTGMAERLHGSLQDELSPEQLEDLEFRHPLIRGYLTENMANMALSGALGEIRHKCDADISAVKERADKGFDAIKERDHEDAAEHFNKVKSDLISLAYEVCGVKNQ